MLTPLQSRLAVNSVTLGDYERPLQISNFVKDLFSGFQLLNLKNDILRKRSDGVKYSVSLPYSIECSEECVTPADSSSATGQEGRGRRLRPLLAEPDSQGRRRGLIETMRNRLACWLLIKKKTSTIQELADFT